MTQAYTSRVARFGVGGGALSMATDGFFGALAVTGAARDCGCSHCDDASPTYIVGQAVILSAQLIVDGVPTDATIFARIRAPDGAVTAQTVTRNGVGSYSFIYAPTAQGLYMYEFAASGAATAAEFWQFIVSGAVF